MCVCVCVCAMLTPSLTSNLSVRGLLLASPVSSLACMHIFARLQRTRNVDNLTGNYVFTLGAYRALYILNWIYRFMTEPGYHAWIAWVAGLVQTAVYVDFFYYYLQAWKDNKKLKLPA